MKKRNILVGILVIGSILCLMGVVSADIDSEWYSETFDINIDDDGLSMDLDSSNYPHNVSYPNDYVEYAKFNGTYWIFETILAEDIEGTEAFYDFALDSNDKEHIVVDTYGNKNLTYVDSNWNKEDILTLPSYADGGAGEYVHLCSIAVDSNNHPHIAFIQEHSGAYNWSLVYAKNTTGTWENETIIDRDISTDCCSFIDIVLDSNDVPHIIFNNGSFQYSKLIYVKGNGAGWDIEAIDWQHYNCDCGCGGCPSAAIAIDSSDNPHIVYTNVTDHDSSSGDSAVVYTKWNGASWEKENIEFKTWKGWTGFTLSLDLDSQDRPHVAYIQYEDYHNTDFRYATRSLAGDWDITILDTDKRSGYHPSLKVDSNGLSHIASYDDDNFDLKYDYQWAHYPGHGIHGNVYLLPLYTEGEDADITCSNDTFSTSTTADDTGYYIFDKLVAGFYWINATLHSYVNNYALVEVVAGYNQTLLDDCDAL